MFPWSIWTSRIMPARPSEEHLRTREKPSTIADAVSAIAKSQSITSASVVTSAQASFASNWVSSADRSSTHLEWSVDISFFAYFPTFNLSLSLSLSPIVSATQDKLRSKPVTWRYTCSLRSSTLLIVWPKKRSNFCSSLWGSACFRPGLRPISSSAIQERDSSATARSFSPYRFPEDKTLDASAPTPSPTAGINEARVEPFIAWTRMERNRGVILSESCSRAACWPKTPNMCTIVLSNKEQNPWKMTGIDGVSTLISRKYSATLWSR